MWTFIFLNHSIAILLTRNILKNNISYVPQFQFFNLSFVKGKREGFNVENRLKSFLRMEISHMHTTFSSSSCSCCRAEYFEAGKRNEDERIVSENLLEDDSLWIILRRVAEKFSSCLSFSYQFNSTLQPKNFYRIFPQTALKLFWHSPSAGSEECDKTGATSTRVEWDELLRWICSWVPMERGK